jgi:hypothetical protein
MEYRGKRYTVVQGIERASWKWTVYLDENTVKSGRAPTREAAKTMAIWTIDKARTAKKASAGAKKARDVNDGDGDSI